MTSSQWIGPDCDGFLPNRCSCATSHKPLKGKTNTQAFVSASFCAHGTEFLSLCVAATVKVKRFSSLTDGSSGLQTRISGWTSRIASSDVPLVFLSVTSDSWSFSLVYKALISFLHMCLRISSSVGLFAGLLLFTYGVVHKAYELGAACAV